VNYISFVGIYKPDFRAEDSDWQVFFSCPECGSAFCGEPISLEAFNDYLTMNSTVSCDHCIKRTSQDGGITSFQVFWFKTKKTGVPEPDMFRDFLDDNDRFQGAPAEAVLALETRRDMRRVSRNRTEPRSNDPNLGLRQLSLLASIGSV